MTFAARTILLALVLAFSPAQAQEQSGTPQEQGGAAQERVHIDTNLICDTQEQVERFVALFDSSKGSAETAMAGVNAEQNTPDACVIATTAYQRGGPVATVKSAHATFDVTRITVIGVYTVNGLERAVPTEFFTLFPHGEGSGTGTVGQRP